MSVDQKQQAMEAQAAEAEAAEADEYEEEEDSGEILGFKQRFLIFMAMPAWLVSMVVHAAVILIMAMIQIDNTAQAVTAVITSAPPTEDLENIEEFDLNEDQPTPIDVNANLADVVPVTSISETIQDVTQDVAIANDVDQAAIYVELQDFGEETAPTNDLYKEIGAFSGKGFEGRGTAESRAAGVRKYGGTSGSEAAVAAALQWIADHQLPDGGWSFDHSIGPIVNGRPRTSDHPGSMREARNGATAMAILPFLGAGQTHVEGKYKPVVKAGMSFLISKMKQDGSLHEGGGSMYAHGLASIALCEAYGMTHDKSLMQPAQAALNFIMYAQDPVGGGWRYGPRQPGDTSVVGWQLMALKSGHMAYLQVSPNTIRGAIKFLDTVQEDYGAYYGYTGPARGQATTAIGLLCRMYLGWKHDHEPLKKGVAFLTSQGPSPNMYFSYYATQVMRQYGGEEWDKWNPKMRDYLVNGQSKEMPAKGSWWFTGGHGADAGGRLYNTAMATMILEVYYRHMPIYQEQATKEDFPL
jgi:hypothetical protein